MFKAVILVCAAAIPSQDCDTRSALDVTQGGEATSLQQCLFSGMSRLAGTALGPGQGTYVKTVCVGQVPRRFAVADGLGG